MRDRQRIQEKVDIGQGSGTSGIVLGACLDSLTTSIAHLAFHPSSQALVFSSRLKKDALRIAHLPSLNVFPNWPTSSTPLSYVHSLDWSPGGGFLAIGNEKGRALLYRAAEFDAC